MKRDYIIKHSKYDYYDDIYPSILKQKPSYITNLLSDLCLRFEHLWHKACYVREHRVACNNGFDYMAQMRKAQFRFSVHFKKVMYYGKSLTCCYVHTSQSYYRSCVWKACKFWFKQSIREKSL